MPRQQPDFPSFRQAGTDPINPLGYQTADTVTMATSGCLPWVPSLAHNPLMPISTIYTLSVQHVSGNLVDTNLVMSGRRLLFFSNRSKSSGYLATPRSTAQRINIATDNYTGKVHERSPLVSQLRSRSARRWEFSYQTALKAKAKLVNTGPQLVMDNTALTLHLPCVPH